MSVGRIQLEILSSGFCLVARVLQVRGPNCMLRLQTFQPLLHGKHSQVHACATASEHQLKDWCGYIRVDSTSNYTYSAIWYTPHAPALLEICLLRYVSL